MIKKYKKFNRSSKFPDTEREIQDVCYDYNIKNYTINDDMSIDVNGDVLFSYKKLSKIPLNFNIVNGFFSCSKNKLMSLKGCPKEIGSYFSCSNNYLGSLEGMPLVLKGNIYCNHNNIKNFKNIPEDFRGILICAYNPIHDIYKLFSNDPNCIYWINEYDVIQGDNIIMDRLEEVFYQLNMKVPDIKKIGSYNLI